jgi:thiosulfate reductase cytochrome b subunit
MRPRFVPAATAPPPSASPPAAMLEDVDLASLRQQHMVAFCVLLGCAIIFICVLSITEREKKEEQ